MTEILDRTAYQRPGSFSEVRSPRIRARPERLSAHLRLEARRARRFVAENTDPCRVSRFPNIETHRALDVPKKNRRSCEQATGRIQKNLNYFKINYFLFSAAVLAFFIVTNPSSLIVLAAIAASWTYVYLVRQEPLKIGERPVSDREKLLGMSGASILAVFFMSSAGSIMLQAFGVALLAIGAHGSMRVPDDLFIDDANADSGFFSFLQPPRPGITGLVA